MQNEESYATRLVKSKHVDHGAAVRLLHVLYRANDTVLSLDNDHNQLTIKNAFRGALKQAKQFDHQFRLTGTCLSIAWPVYVIEDNTPTVDRRIAVSEALTKGIMQLRDDTLVSSTD